MKVELTKEVVESIRDYGTHIIGYEQRAETVIALCDLALKSFAPPEELRTIPGAIRLAVWLHDTYEALAPEYGYETKPETRVFDASSPNGKLMIAVCRKLRETFALSPPRRTKMPDECILGCPPNQVCDYCQGTGGKDRSQLHQSKEK